MKRIDLRNLGHDFLEQLDHHMLMAQPNEVIIFLFEIGDFSPVELAIKHSKEKGYELMNSLKFNQTDWTLVLKKADNGI